MIDAKTIRLKAKAGPDANDWFQAKPDGEVFDLTKISGEQAKILLIALARGELTLAGLDATAREEVRRAGR